MSKGELNVLHVAVSTLSLNLLLYKKKKQKSASGLAHVVDLCAPCLTNLTHSFSLLFYSFIHFFLYLCKAEHLQNINTRGVSFHKDGSVCLPEVISPS